MKDKYKLIMELCRRRGFLWPSFEIYGEVAGFWDYGPLGAGLKNRIIERWREIYVKREGFYEIDTPTIGIEDVFIASGHVSEFTDPLVRCLKCNAVYRADHLVEISSSEAEIIEREIREGGISCPECGGELSNVYYFNLMFRTTIGPEGERIGYLRPETAQGIFINFLRLFRFNRERLPFGIAQVGKAYRNEISPRQGLIRLREFTQCEVEYFVDPEKKNDASFKDLELLLVPRDGEERRMKLSEALSKGFIAHALMAYHMTLIHEFLTSIGIPEDKIRFRQHRADEMAHYANDCWDAEVFSSRFGWIEVVGLADRGDYDLRAHMEHSKVDLRVDTGEEIGERRKVVKPLMNRLGPVYKERAKKIAEAMRNLEFREGSIRVEVDGEILEIPEEFYEAEEIRETRKIIPHVIEPSFGVDRILYVLLEHAYEEEDVNGELRVLLKLPPGIAPVDAAVFPLVNDERLVEIAKSIARELSSSGFQVEYDDSGSIGRRYRRQDEIGTPFCITVDFETLEDDSVTLRFRDTMAQERVSRADIRKRLNELLRRC
ncbi:MAG: glycine--tRNA ligase [Archaeoglobi archaeon]|nr:glycine--tRNA ligase [Candidatus Mnemosynella sp.]